MAVKKKGKLAGLQKKAPARDTPAENPGFSVPESISHIWLAGLGALARAQAEGPRLLESLIADGKRVQKGGKIGAPVAPASIAAAADLARSAGEHLRKQSSEGWENLEVVFRDRVGRALEQLNAPTAEKLNDIDAELQALKTRISALEKESKPLTGETLSPTVKSRTRSRAKSGTKTG
jgi:poly(hydroxyalkanoate) granule-associated protein